MNKQQIVNKVYETTNSYNHYNIIVVWKDDREWKYENGHRISDCIESNRHRNDPKFEDFGAFRIFNRNDKTTKKDILLELEFFTPTKKKDVGTC